MKRRAGDDAIFSRSIDERVAAGRDVRERERPFCGLERRIGERVARKVEGKCVWVLKLDPIRSVAVFVFEDSVRCLELRDLRRNGRGVYRDGDGRHGVCRTGARSGERISRRTAGRDGDSAGRRDASDSADGNSRRIFHHPRKSGARRQAGTANIPCIREEIADRRGHGSVSFDFRNLRAIRLVPEVRHADEPSGERAGTIGHAHRIRAALTAVRAVGPDISGPIHRAGKADVIRHDLHAKVREPFWTAVVAIKNNDALQRIRRAHIHGVKRTKRRALSGMRKRCGIAVSDIGRRLPRPRGAGTRDDSIQREVRCYKRLTRERTKLRELEILHIPIDSDAPRARPARRAICKNKRLRAARRAEPCDGNRRADLHIVHVIDANLRAIEPVRRAAAIGAVGDFQPREIVVLR